MAKHTDSRLTVGIPCRVDEPDLEGTLVTLVDACRASTLPRDLRTELVLCINGWTEEIPCPPLVAARQLSTRLAIAFRQYDQPAIRPREDDEPLVLTVLLSRRMGKAIAWNMIRQWSASEAIVFCDADVRVNAEAVSALYAALQASPTVRLVASQQVPVVTATDSWPRRAAALPYRFYFHNVTGGLYIIHRDALVGQMPEGLLFEDAWLTLVVGHQWIQQEPRAQVFFLPPATWHDWIAERTRTEAGKRQLHLSYPQLFVHGPAAKYPWRDFVRSLRCGDVPLVGLLLAMRMYTRWRAWWRFREGHSQELWRVVGSSKQWKTPR
ncbi:MAG: glycosyltransferase [Deltaproteobacteria bacterium]|nr:glycosyltransferase [Deltaproteobacteria bacterium]